MTNINKIRAVLLATALFGSQAWAGSALAQEVSDSEASAQMLQAQLEALQAQMTELKDRLAKSEKAQSWKGAPQASGSGFSFKVRGRIQYDAAVISESDDLIEGKAEGFHQYFRRVRLGVEGAMPGDFKYKAEFDFADPETVGYGDVLIEYAPKDSPFSVKLGNMETNATLEQMTSSRFITFMERAQITEAFYTGRRLGASLGFTQGDVKFDAGFFGGALGANETNEEWLFGSRLVYSPEFGGNQLHFGLNYQHREFNTSALEVRYRARPFVRAAGGLRFADTRALAGKSDDTFGVEAAGIFGPMHAVAEWQFTKLNAIKPGDSVDAGDTVTGTLLRDDASFNGGYVELGYFFTGESRGYKAGTWDRTKVLNPIDKGGMGALSINARVDYLDLSDNVGNGGTAQFVNGGRQIGYGVSLNWMPIDYVKFMAQYFYVDLKDINNRGGNSFGGVGTSEASLSSNANVFGLRAQIDW